MVIDIHVHLTPKKGILNEAGNTYATAEELIEMMNRLGIEKAAVLPTVNPEGAHRIQSIEEILQVCERYQDRFISFCNIDPRLKNNSPGKDFSPILSYYKEKGCKGVGEICANLYIDDPRCKNLFFHCGECEMPVLFHMAAQIGDAYGLADDIYMPRLEKVLKEFPKTIFIGHATAFWSEITSEVDEETRGGYPKGPVKSPGRVPELLAKHPNLYGDLSAGSGYNAISRDIDYSYKFLEKFQDKLLFGTDICNVKQDVPIVPYFRKILAEGKISQIAYNKITNQNAVRLLRLI